MLNVAGLLQLIWMTGGVVGVLVVGVGFAKRWRCWGAGLSRWTGFGSGEQCGQSKVSGGAWPGWLAHLGVRQIARGVCGIVVVNHHLRHLMAAPCADEYLGIHFKARIVWLNQFEP